MFWNIIVSSLLFYIFEIVNRYNIMEKPRVFKLNILLISLILSVFIVQNLYAQPVVGLDNWYNHETNAKTGKLYHYLWTDTAFSGYSRWGKIFTGRGAKITTLGKPDASVLNKSLYYS
jgi:hypothetical protein